MKKNIVIALALVLIVGISVMGSAAEKITLRYASWEDPKIEKAMIEEFMKQHPDIEVINDESINWPWNESLAAAASAGNLPDVFFVFNIPTSIQNDWLMDINPYWKDDKDARRVYDDVAATAVYNGKRYAAPAFIYPRGVYVNKSLFKKYNVELPSYDWTVDEMIELAKKLTYPADHVYGLAGTIFHEILPAVNNEQFGWQTWDGEKFNFTDQSWIDAYNLQLDLIRMGVIEQMTAEEKAEVFGDENAWPFVQGNVAMQIDYGWNLGWLPKSMKESGAGEVDFYPYPAGEAGHRTYVVPDYIGMSSTTEHPEAAFELMKFMTFGKDGMIARLKIYQELGMDISAFPVADYPVVWTMIEDRVDTPGVKAVIDTLDNTFSDVFKWLPGIDQFHKWAGEEKIWDRLKEGEVSAADLAPEMEEKANQIVKDAYEMLK